MKWQVRTIQAVFGCWAAVVVIRLGFWQIVKASELKHQAQFQYGSVTVLPAPRGDIKSQDNFPLVGNIDTYLLYLNPQKFPPEEIASLAGLLPATESAQKITSLLSRNDLSWVAAAHHLSSSQKTAIEKLSLPGLGFEPEPSRLYYEGSHSAYLSGFVGQDENGQPQGYFGLEGFYNRLLSGKPGKIIQEKDALNRPIVIGEANRISAVSGQSLVTSIDRTVQFIVFKHLERALEKYGALSGTVSVMDSKSGQVISMVSLPNYDPQNYSSFDPALYKNPIVSDSYEPGSTFKTVVMAAALDAGVVTPQTICTICDGPAVVGDKAVRSWNDHYYPGSDMRDVILHSDNVGMVFVSQKLGKTRLLDYIRRFGFGRLTGVDLQEESTPVIRPDTEWYDIDIATTAFGQGIAVTPLQMLTAVNTIANGGILLPPRIVTHIETEEKLKPQAPPTPVKVISRSAAAKITEMMVNGVTKGEVRYYKPPGYLIAGKTGTAQVPIEGHYDKDKTIASFVGFAPADNPKFTMLVTIREPQSSPWGSTTAAPLWFDISRELFRYYHLPPNVPQEGI